jgi:hypothetical protein
VDGLNQPKRVFNLYKAVRLVPIYVQLGYARVVRVAQRPEHQIAALAAKLPPDQRPALQHPLSTPALKAPQGTAMAAPAVAFVNRLSLPQHARLVAPRSVPNPQLAQRNEKLRAVLCGAYNNNLPGFQSACQSTVPKLLPGAMTTPR